MEKSFENFKNYILINAKEKDACSSQIKEAETTINFTQLLGVIKNNANWCYVNKLVNADILEKYVPDIELLSANIYVKKERIVQNNGLCLYYSSTSKHYGSSTSKHYGSSTSEHYESSTSEHYGSSTSKHYESSTSKHYGSSTSKHYESSTSKHYGSSTSEHYGSSTSEHYGSSTSEHYGSSTSEHYDSSTSKHYGSSTSKHYESSTSKHYESSTFGSVYILKDTSIIHDQAIIRERSTNKVYFKKSAFEIVEL